MNTPRFLVAKYVPDARRMEPRNMGMIVWNNGEVACRFIEDASAGLRRLHVMDMHAYRQWIVSWKLQCAKKVLRLKDGTQTLRTAPEFVDALRLYSSENFLLFDGGVINENVRPEHTRDLLNELFVELVAEEPKEEEVRMHTADDLRKDAAKALKRSGLMERDDWKDNIHWTCPVGDTVQPFKFDHVIYGTHPRAIIQRVPLLNHGEVYRTVFQFEKMQEAKYVNHNSCAALVHFDQERRNNALAIESYKLLSQDGIVINVADPETAAAQLHALGLAI